MNTAILGTGSYLPPNIMTSDELGDRLGVGEQWIIDKTGISERRVAAPGDFTSDLAAHAANKALNDADVPADEIDIVILATATKDQPIPATAPVLQAKIGAARAAAFDVDAACTGFIYGLIVADAMLMANLGYKKALVVGAELYSRFLNYEDRRTCVLLGDGAGAVVLGKVPGGSGLLSSALVSDGSRAALVEIPAGGSRQPANENTVATKGHFLRMRGREVRDLAAKVMPGLIMELLGQANLGIGDVRLIVPHQANGVMLAEWGEALTLGAGQMHTTVAHYGNTGAASVPITLDDAAQNGRIRDGDALLLVAFGGGMTWGGVTVRWGRGI